MPNNQYKIDIKEWLETHFQVYDATYPDVHLNCVFCQDQRARLYVAYADKGKSKKGHCYCHNEQKTYSFFELYATTENLSDVEAANQLFDHNPDPVYASMEDLKNKLKQVDKEEEELPSVPLKWPEGYIPLFGLTEAAWNQRCPKYMQDRKITQLMCNQFYLGFCVGGLFTHRMIVPVYFKRQLVAYQGRAMYPCKERKYLFNEGIKIGEYLFNYDNIPDEADTLILVEGVFDAWALIRAGFKNVVATFGKHLTDRCIEKILKRFKRVLIFWDMDAIPEINDLAERLEGYMNVDVTFLQGKDPDEATSEEVSKAVMSCEPYSFDFKGAALKIRAGR